MGNVKIKITKNSLPKGGYCGCKICRVGLTIQYKNSGQKVDGIFTFKKVPIGDGSFVKIRDKINL